MSTTVTTPADAASRMQATKAPELPHEAVSPAASAGAGGVMPRAMRQCLKMVDYARKNCQYGVHSCVCKAMQAGSGMRRHS